MPVAGNLAPVHWRKPFQKVLRKNRIRYRFWKKAGGSRNGADRDDATALVLVDASPLPQSAFECDITPQTIPDLRSFCEQWAVFCGLEEVEAYQIVLACDEIFTNVYKHAYSGGSGPVRVDATIDLDSLTFLVTHTGIGLTSETEAPQAPEDSRLGGYGLPFIRRVFDEVKFDTRTGFSKVSLRKNIPISG
jgi:anti-sigma regulatory factor (Ser/Thr protein kinase)